MVQHLGSSRPCLRLSLLFCLSLASLPLPIPWEGPRPCPQRGCPPVTHADSRGLLPSCLPARSDHSGHLLLTSGWFTAHSHPFLEPCSCMPRRPQHLFSPRSEALSCQIKLGGEEKHRWRGTCCLRSPCRYQGRSGFCKTRMPWCYDQWLKGFLQSLLPTDRYNRAGVAHAYLCGYRCTKTILVGFLGSGWGAISELAMVCVLAPTPASPWESSDFWDNCPHISEISGWISTPEGHPTSWKLPFLGIPSAAR